MHQVAPLSLACVVALVAVSSCTTSTIKPISHKSVAIPTKVPVQLTPEKNQHNFDAFSWNAFIALNWPVEGSEPDPKRLIGEGPDSKTVWESWQSREATFLPDGQKPVWGQPAPLPAACEGVGDPGLEVLSMSQLSDTAVASTDQFDTGPLIDQNGQFVRYEIRMNRAMFDYIVENELYTRAGQEQHGKVFFPCSKGKKVGATLLKAAWKVLGPDDDPARFHTRESLVYTPDASAPEDESKGSCKVERLGLVGFHIASKLHRTPLWVWSTFEHSDNVPTDDEAMAGSLPLDHYHFYNAECRTETGEPCNFNAIPPEVNPAQAPATPSQIVRNVPLTPGAVALNDTATERFNAVLQGSLWANYQLISTQWPTVQSDKCDKIERQDLEHWPKNGDDALFSPTPLALANSTIESYDQPPNPNRNGNRAFGEGSSCMHCHLGATTLAGEFSDFTFTLWEAK